MRLKSYNVTVMSEDISLVSEKPFKDFSSSIFILYYNYFISYNKDLILSDFCKGQLFGHSSDKIS